MKIVYLLSPGVASDLYHAFGTLHRTELDSFAIFLSPNVVSKKQDHFVVSHGPIAISKPSPPQALNRSTKC